MACYKAYVNINDILLPICEIFNELWTRIYQTDAFYERLNEINLFSLENSKTADFCTIDSDCWILIDPSKC
jgi:hypothetical protein